MHPKLKTSPITYVLAQVRFSNIENIGDYIPKLQDKIRDLFPHFDKKSIQAIQLREDQVATSLILNQWHFLDKKRLTGIIIDDRSITLHTSQYDSYLILTQQLEEILKRFNELLKFGLFTRIGLRYINLIDKRKDEAYINKINAGLRGFTLEENISEADKFLTKTETTQVTKQGIIKIQATRVGNKDSITGIKNLFVPLDLVETANILSFQNFEPPNDDFLILDLDHFKDKEDDFNIETILECFNKLHDVLYEVFVNAIGQDLLNKLS